MLQLQLLAPEWAHCRQNALGASFRLLDGLTAGEMLQLQLLAPGWAHCRRNALGASFRLLDGLTAGAPASALGSWMGSLPAKCAWG